MTSLVPSAGMRAAKTRFDARNAHLQALAHWRAWLAAEYAPARPWCRSV